MSGNERHHDEAPRPELYDSAALKLLMSRVREDPETKCLHYYSRRTGQRTRGMLIYRGVKILAHRLSYMAHKGPIPEGLVVCHRCDNPSCIAIDHLFVGTQQENIADMWRKGRARWGLTKLRAEDVAEMKRRLLDGESIAALAREKRVSYGLVFQIKHGKTWKQIRPAAKSSRALTIESISSAIEFLLPEEDRKKLWRLAELRRLPFPKDCRPYVSPPDRDMDGLGPKDG
jgi:HNH endonuclease